MSLLRFSMRVSLALTLLGAVACTSSGDELSACMEGRWKVAPDRANSGALEQLGQSMIVYDLRRSTLVVATTTGEVIEEKRFTLEAKDRRHGWLDVEGGERVEVEADEGCGALILATEATRFELRRAE